MEPHPFDLDSALKKREGDLVAHLREVYLHRTDSSHRYLSPFLAKRAVLILDRERLLYPRWSPVKVGSDLPDQHAFHFVLIEPLRGRSNFCANWQSQLEGTWIRSARWRVISGSPRRSWSGRSVTS